MWTVIVESVADGMNEFETANGIFKTKKEAMTAAKKIAVKLRDDHMREAELGEDDEPLRVEKRENPDCYGVVDGEGEFEEYFYWVTPHEIESV